MVLGNLAGVALDRGEADSAAALWRSALEVMRTVSGEESADAARMMRSLGAALHRRGAVAEAQELLERAVKIRRKVHGDSHLGVAAAELTLAHLVRDRGALERSDTLYGRAIAMWRDLEGEADGLGAGLNGRGRLRLAQGRLLEAESLQREALSLTTLHHPADHWTVALAQADLGAALAAQQRYAEAESLLAPAYPLLGPFDQPRAAATLVALYEAWGKPALAGRYRKSGPAIH
jgi:tetratricopeptide (TPR) repeat protein